MPLMRTVPFDPRETPRSVAARLAAANGVPAIDFARDMRFCLAALDTGDTKALAVLSQLAGIPVANLRSTAILRREDGVWIGAQKLSLRNVAQNRPRVCPVCLQEDLEGGMEPKLEARPRYRVTWTVPFVLTCPVHRCLLISPRELTMGSSSSIPDSMRRHPSWIHRAARSTTGAPASPLENWLAERLAGSETAAGFLEQLPLYVGARLANVTGWSMALGEHVPWESLTDIEKVEAGAAGFALAQSSLEEFLGEIGERRNSTTPVTARPKSRGFMAWLGGNIQNPDYAPLLDWVREHAIDHQPLGPGDTFLGPITRRSLHSIYSASKEHGVHPKRLRKLLVQAGIVHPDTTGLSDSQVVFRVEAAHHLISAAAEEIIGEDARVYLGMTRVQWGQIRKAKLIDTLFPESDETRRAYSRAELDRFLGSVRYEKGEGADLVSIAKAVKIAVTGYVDVVRLLRDHRLDRVSIDTSRKGFAGILVDAHEVKREVPKPAMAGLTSRQAAQRIGVAIETVHALTELGVLPSAIHQTYGGGRKARLVRPADLAAFLVEYIPLSELADRLNVSFWPRHACRIMEAEGVLPVFDRGMIRTIIYRRTDVLPILAAST